MDIDFNSISEAFESKIRIAIQCSLLNGPKSFSELKEITGATDGNLSSHLTKLENIQHIIVDKAFVGKRPKTTYTLTELGRQKLSEYVDLLESLIKLNDK